ncbi:MAG: hypothetical protein JWN70_1430, partial [Planctomycetaceae bacterium]|nr:hypothetical protein [Planctomycetaceae bacterium]
GTASYAGNRGAQNEGPFVESGRVYRMTDITDGLTYTVGVMEAGAYAGAYAGSPIQAWAASHPYQPAWVGHVSGQDTTSFAIRYGGRQEWWSRVNGPHPYAPTSGHPGGLHALGLDGGVHWVTTTINPAVWASLCSPKRIVVNYINFAVAWPAGSGGFNTGYGLPFTCDWNPDPVNTAYLRENQAQWQDK